MTERDSITTGLATIIRSSSVSSRKIRLTLVVGDTNLNSYVSNGPCNATDPSGQFMVAEDALGMLRRIQARCKLGTWTT